MTDLSRLGENADGKPKSFWQKPEGMTGMLFIGAAALGGFWLLDRFLPTLIRLAENTLYLAGLLVVLAIVFFLLTNKDIRTGFFYLFKMAMRSVTGAIIELNPIAIMKIYIQDLREKRVKLSEQIDVLAGQKGKLDKKIQDNNEAIREFFARANKANSLAQQEGMTEAASLATIEGAGLQEMNEKLLPLQQNITKVLSFLEKVYRSSDFIIKQMEIKVKLKEAEYEIVKSSSGALKSALSVFKGDPDKRMMFDRSLEYIQEDMGKKLGEMKRAMELSMDFINGVDIQTGVSNDKGLAMLEAYNRGEGFSLVLDAQQGQSASITGSTTGLTRDSLRESPTPRTNLLE